MQDGLAHAMSMSGFMPHGYCFLWTPSVLWSHVLSDAVIAVSYFSIPIALWTFARRRADLPFRGVFVLFGLFVIACGMTHLYSIWNIWNADYRPEGWLKVFTAALSAVTAVILWPLIPRALAIPSQAQLEEAIAALEREVARRTAVEQELRTLNQALEERGAALAASERELQRSNAELEQFAYVASHDLQEPLRMITGFVGLLEQRLSSRLDAETREFMAFVTDGAQRMRGLIQDILAYSRVSTKAGTPEPLDAALAVQQALQALAARMSETGARVEIGTLPTVVADRTQLAQLFQNLIANALKFRGAASPIVRINARHDGANWRFAVIDNGIGIAPEFRERIFGIFQRLHSREKFEGTGIGLAICKRIVERHGGTLGVEAADGGGSEFWFTIPAGEAS